MKTIIPVLVICITAFTVGCKWGDDGSVDDVMVKYANCMSSLDIDSMMNLYTEDGILAGEGQQKITGRDSIRKVLKSFSGFNMLEYKTTSVSTKITADSAAQTGVYVQHVITPAKDTLHPGSSYDVKFKKEGRHWLIVSMYTYGYKKL